MEIIKLPCADSKAAVIVETDYNELHLCDDYFLHRAKGIKSCVDDKMGDGIWIEKKFHYEHRYLKKNVASVDVGWYHEDEIYLVSIEMTGLDNENVAFTETYEEAIELSDKIWNWLTSSTKP